MQILGQQLYFHKKDNRPINFWKCIHNFFRHLQIHAHLISTNKKHNYFEVRKSSCYTLPRVSEMLDTLSGRNNYAFYYIIEYKLSLKILITSSDNVRIYCFIIGAIKWIPATDSALETAT